MSRTGMPLSHGKAFQSVADKTGDVIASREVGKWAEGLLLESYATKGFHNKAKSCPWGPMAGFVMADRRFTKNTDTEGQRKDLVKSESSGATEIPLYITEERRRALEGPLGRITRAGGNINEMVYQAQGPGGISMKFVLKRTLDGPGASGKVLWAVFYAPGEVRLSNTLTDANTRQGGQALLPVMAMVDAACPAAVRKTYRAATTGDYDLWAIFTRRTHFSPGGGDKRMVPGSDRFVTPLSTFNANEDEHKGNLTPRIAKIRELLNSAVRSLAGYAGGDVVHHSDEAGRPMISSIDFPCIVFVPKVLPYLVTNIPELKELICALNFDYVISLNPGWQRQLGIIVSKGGSYTV